MGQNCPVRSASRVAVASVRGGVVSPALTAEAALSANFAPEAIEGLSVDGSGMISDLHGSGEYRAHLVTVMTRRAVAAAH